ncbi:MAG: VTC domain-containing protein [Christensenellaceae bacterium]|nr:VTC domain-containing protein [Christensenellaceae bacterium]
MKKEDEIFRKLKNEKPLIKTAADEKPVRRIGGVPQEPAEPKPQAEVPRRRTAPAEADAPKRRTAPTEARRPIAAAEPAQRPARRQIAVPALDAEKVLTDKIGDDPRTFEKPHQITKPAGERKPLTYRHEKKYYISYGDYLILRQQLKALMHVDEHADQSGQYYIRSLYLDDIYNTAVAEKMSGVQFRHKYRIRIYDFKKTFIRFEKKIKNGPFIAKDSFPMTYDEYLAFVRGDIEFLLHKPEPLAKEVYLAVRQTGLKPVVVVDYEREPFVMNYETIRITFDKNLRSGDPTWDIFDKSLPRASMYDKGIVVMEVKYNKALPDYIANLINGISGLQGSAISKYIICRQYD